jgi:hypothetical protein
MTYITMSALIEAAAVVTGVPVEAITARNNTNRIVHIRACIVRIANKERLSIPNHISRWTLPRIAKALGYRDHSTVLNLIEKWEAHCRSNPELPEIAEAIERLARNPEGVSDIVKEAELPPSHYLKRKNDFRPDEGDESDSGHAFHTRVAKASLKFVKALRAARGEGGE